MLRYLTLELDTILRGLERNYKLRLDARRLDGDGAQAVNCA
jgi:hypothetical protein